MKRTWKSFDWIALAGLAGLWLCAGCLSAEQGAEPTGQLSQGLVPPPPVNQNLGVYDKEFSAFVEADCRGCHAKSGATVSPFHHALLDPENPHYKPTFNCLTCHKGPYDPGCDCYTLQAVHDCTACHKSSPHHVSTWALEHHCSHCHGSLVNDYDDGHAIPSYAKSVVTPDPRCRVWTDETKTVCKSGGCQACHVAATAVSPMVASTGTLHHAASKDCSLCHGAHDLFDIRACEQCHGPSALHSIEFDYDTNTGVPGWGHIGADADCWGCHGWYSKEDLPQAFGLATPTVARIEPSDVKGGQDTEIVVTGAGFTSAARSLDAPANAMRPTLVLSRSGGQTAGRQELVLEATSYSDSTLRAILPAKAGRGSWEVRVYKDHGGPLEKRSNLSRLTVVPRAAMTSTLVNGALVIVGGDFGPEPKGAESLGVFVGKERCSISQWSRARIIARCGSARAGAPVKVKTIFDEVSAAVSGAGPHWERNPLSPPAKRGGKDPE
jgi:hypothetical protein